VCRVRGEVYGGTEPTAEVGEGEGNEDEEDDGYDAEDEYPGRGNKCVLDGVAVVLNQSISYQLLDTDRPGYFSETAGSLPSFVKENVSVTPVNTG